MTTRDIMVALATVATLTVMGAAAPQSSPPQVTTGAPIVQNGQLSATTSTIIIPGTGSGYWAYSLTNESAGDGIRCEYGGITGQAPTVPPAPNTGSLIGPGVTLVERTAPSNRLDCIATAGAPKYDITLYPK